MNNNNKTPLSVLYEITQKKKMHLKYEQLPTIIDNTFAFRVSVDDVHAIGKGRSKQSAKQDAAKKVLEELQTLGYELEDIKNVQNIISDTRINTVGILKSFANVNQIASPVYNILSEKGMPHCKTFTIECKFNSFVTQGTANSKKQAKELASQNMLTLFKDTLPKIQQFIDDPPVSSDMDIEEVIKNFTEKSQRFKSNENTYSNYSQSIKMLMKRYNLTYNDLWKDVRIESFPEFNQLMRKLRLKFSLHYMDDINNKIIAFLTIYASPHLVLAEFGESKYEAMNVNLDKAFQLLKILSK